MAQYTWTARPAGRPGRGPRRLSRILAAHHPLEATGGNGAAQRVSGCRSDESIRSRGGLGAREGPRVERVTHRAPRAFVDPLSAMLAEDEDDDLDSITAEDLMDAKSSSSNSDEDSPRSELEDLWHRLDKTAGSDCESVRIRIPEGLHYVLDKLNFDDEDAHRNARLDLLEGRQTSPSCPEKNGLTPKQFGDFLELITHQLSSYWKDDKRVHVLRLVIQLAKILGDVMSKSILAGYSAFYFQITEVLRFFGQLVYDRIASKCPGLRVNFTSNDATPQAQEMCKNWLMKIMSIRELIPRLYLEIAFMKCYRFIDDPEYYYKTVMDRLTKSIRGVADPIVASYLRMYLVRSAQQALQSSNMTLAQKVSQSNYSEFASTYAYFGSDKASDFGMSSFEYLMLYSPVFKWLLSAQLHGLSPFDQDQIMKKCLNEVDTKKCPGFVYEHLFAVLSPSLIEGQVNHIVHLVSNCARDPNYPVQNIICVFGQSLLHCQSLTKPEKLNVLNTTWHCIMDIHDLEAYLRCALIWTEFTVKQLQSKEVNVILGNIVSQTNSTLSKDGPRFTSDQLPKIIRCLLENSVSLEQTLTMGNFLPLFNAMGKSAQTEIAKDLVENATKDLNQVTDPVMINVLIQLCDILADSINALSIQDETRQISTFISHVIRHVDFEEDFEQQLKFFTECRGKYSHLMAVQIQLIHCVHLLAVNTLKRLKGKSSTRTKGFLQACCAFVYITVPSIAPPVTQMHLSIESAQICFMCHCFGQGESNLKAVYQTMSEIGQDYEAEKNSRGKREVELILLDLCSNLFSLLLVVPDNVEHGILFMIRAALNAINKFPWAKGSTTQADLNVRAIQLLSVVTWDQYPYQMAGLNSNDVLYGSNSKFVEEVNQISGTILTQVLDQIQEFTSNGQSKEASWLSWQLFQVVYAFGHVEVNEKLAKLAKKLWSLSVGQKDLESQTSRLVRQLSHAKNEDSEADPNHFWRRLLKC